jgi:O-antigen/teichoic acid export membrane protein
MNLLVRNSTIYLTSSLIASAVPFILLPILTRLLSPEEYGLVAIFTALTAGLTGLIGLCVTGSAERKFYDAGISESNLSQYNSVCLILVILSMFFTLAAANIFDTYVVELVGISANWIYLAIISTAANIIIAFRMGQWQIRNRALAYSVLQLFSAGLNLTLSLVFVFVFLLGAEGRMKAIVATNVLVAGISVYSIFRQKLIAASALNFAYVKEALAYGIPLIPHVLGNFFLASADRLVIGAYLGMSEVGIYLVAVQISSILLLIFMSINKALTPWLFSILKENDPVELTEVVKKIYLLLFLLVLIGVSLTFADNYLIGLVGSQYVEASSIIGYLLFGQVFGGMYLLFTNLIFYAKKTGSLSVVTILTGSAHIFLVFMLLPDFGLIGAAQAFCVAKAFQFFSTWVVAVRVSNLPLLKPWGGGRYQ